MATVPVKEVEVVLRCLQKATVWTPLKPLVAQIQGLLTHLGKDCEENFCQHLCVPWPPSIRLKACSEYSHCCSGGCHASLMFIPSFLRKGKNKPKAISPEVILC